MNKYVQSPLVLGCICVCSAGLIGGLHLVAEKYAEAHKSTEAPKEIQSLKPGATFVEVADFKPTSFTGDATKVTLESVYEMQEGGKRTGFAYSVNCGKPVKTDVTFTVAFEGEVSESTVAQLKPIAINVTSGGDAGYDANTVSYAQGIVDGSKQFNDVSDIVSGGTKSQKFLRDGLTAARTDYLARYNGAAPTPQPTDETLVYFQKMYPTLESYSEDKDFKSISSSTDYDGETEIAKRYRAEVDGKVVFFYEGKGTIKVTDYGADNTGSVDLLVAYDAEVTNTNRNQIAPSHYVVVSCSFSVPDPSIDWEDYIKGIISGDKDVFEDGDLMTGATRSCLLVQDLLIGMRKDYHTTRLAEIKAGVGGAVSKIFSADATYEEDAAFTAIETEGYSISKLYTVALSETETAKLYLGTAQAAIEADGTTSKITLYVGFSETAKLYLGTAQVAIEADGNSISKITLYVGFSGTAEAEANVHVAGYSEVSSNGFDQWKGFMDGLSDGSKSLDNDADITTGATHSTRAVRDMVKGMRSHYFSSLSK